MITTHYRVLCLDCGAQSRVSITGEIIYEFVCHGCGTPRVQVTAGIDYGKVHSIKKRANHLSSDK